MSVAAADAGASIETGCASVVGAAATCVAGLVVAVGGGLGEQAEMARARAVVERIRASMGSFLCILPRGDGGYYPAMA
jgi:hypothetical protein